MSYLHDHNIHVFGFGLASTRIRKIVRMSKRVHVCVFVFVFIH
jgi:hypothetical protein